MQLSFTEELRKYTAETLGVVSFQPVEISFTFLMRKGTPLRDDVRRLWSADGILRSRKNASSKERSILLTVLQILLPFPVLLVTLLLLLPQYL
jgi:hypothetical protein